MEQAERESQLVERLRETSAAHFEYETNVLHGVYDSQWSEWYAKDLLDHDIASVLGRAVTTTELAEWLRAADANYRREPQKVSWQEYYARDWFEHHQMG